MEGVRRGARSTRAGCHCGGWSGMASLAVSRAGTSRKTPVTYSEMGGMGWWRVTWPTRYHEWDENMVHIGNPGLDFASLGRLDGGDKNDRRLPPKGRPSLRDIMGAGGDSAAANV